MMKRPENSTVFYAGYQLQNQPGLLRCFTTWRRDDHVGGENRSVDAIRFPMSSFGIASTACANKFGDGYNVTWIVFFGFQNERHFFH
jgi:hypothetical protein